MISDIIAVPCCIGWEANLKNILLLLCTLSLSCLAEQPQHVWATVYLSNQKILEVQLDLNTCSVRDSADAPEIDCKHLSDVPGNWRVSVGEGSDNIVLRLTGSIYRGKVELTGGASDNADVKRYLHKNVGTYITDLGENRDQKQAARSASTPKLPKPNAFVLTIGSATIIVARGGVCNEYESGRWAGQCFATKTGDALRITDAGGSFALGENMLRGDAGGGTVVNDSGKQVGTYAMTHMNLPDAGWQAWLNSWAANFSRNVQALEAQRTQQLQQDQQALQRRQLQEDLNSQLLQLRQQIERTNQCLSYGNCY
jgi:hypothetical protein